MLSLHPSIKLTKATLCYSNRPTHGGIGATSAFDKLNLVNSTEFFPRFRYIVNELGLEAAHMGQNKSKKPTPFKVIRFNALSVEISVNEHFDDRVWIMNFRLVHLPDSFRRPRNWFPKIVWKYMNFSINSFFEHNSCLSIRPNRCGVLISSPPILIWQLTGVEREFATRQFGQVIHVYQLCITYFSRI